MPALNFAYHSLPAHISPMESSAAGDRQPSLPDSASPPPPLPPPPRGWLAGFVSGAGRILAAVLGPDSPGSDSDTTAATSSDAASPSASSSPGGHGDRDDLREINQLNQTGKEMVLKDYAEGCLAIFSEIDTKDAITQLLMQETYSRSECNTLIKIIQERVVDLDSAGVDPGGIALPIAWHAGRQQQAVAHYSFSPNSSPPGTSNLPASSPDFDSNAVMGEMRRLEVKRPTMTLGPTDQGPCTVNTDKIQPVLKRSYSIAGDTFHDSRRVKPKLNGDLSNISKFEQVDVLRIRAAETSFRGSTEDAKKLFSDVPLLGTNNLTYSDIISKGASAEETAKPFGSTSSQVGGGHKNYDSTILDRHSSKDLKEEFPIKVEPINIHVHFEPHMMDLAQQKHDDTIRDDSCSVSKLMFKEDIEAAPSSSVGKLENGSKNRRRGANSLRTTTTTTRSPAKSSGRRRNGITIKSEHDLLEQSKLILMEEDPDWVQVQAKRAVRRPRKGI